MKLDKIIEKEGIIKEVILKGEMEGENIDEIK